MRVSTPRSKVWKSEKSISVSGLTPIPYKKSQIEPKFVPPDLNISLTVRPTALAGAIARTSALKNVPQDISDRLTENALNLCRCLIDENSPSLVTSNIKYLADADKISFAGCVGAGITDLLMNTLDYAWRDNAEKLSTGSRPDFIYGGGNAQKLGVVIAEAHGSFSKSVTETYIRNRSEEKYCKQVHTNLEEMYTANEKVIHGYSIAYGANPITHNVALHVSETDIRKPKQIATSSSQSENPDQIQTVPVSLALATHRANFSLMGANYIVDWIDWLRGEDASQYPVDRPPLLRRRIRFRAFSYAGRKYLYVPTVARRSPWPYYRFAFANIFAMEMDCAREFLNQLGNLINRKLDAPEEELPRRFELPHMKPVGFGIEPEDETTASKEMDSLFAMYRDGLAVFGEKFDLKQAKPIRWHPIIGI